MRYTVATHGDRGSGESMDSQKMSLESRVYFVHELILKEASMFS